LPTLALSDLDYLLPTTKNVLLQLATFRWLDQFTFVGGSGLSLYLHHRLSEDIDLFTWNDKLPKSEMLPGLQEHFENNLRIEQSGKQQLDLVINDVQVSFFANDWEALKNNQLLKGNLFVASLDLLVGMKLNTLFLRAKFRDYYDLYALNLAGYTLSEMYQIIEGLMPGINKRLFQMALTYTEDIEEDSVDHLNPKYAVTKEEISKHFEEQIIKWLNH